MEAPTRERIVTNALRLFAERGFKGTSIVEIEAASGLAPGSGSLYTHFRSKEDVLVAAVEHSVALTEAGYAAFAVLPLGDLRAELTLVVRGALLVMDTSSDLIRVLLKEAEQFPTILGRARDDVFERGHRWFSDWLSDKAKAGEVSDADFDVLAAIWLGAIRQYWIARSLLGGAPLDVEESRFVMGCVDLLLAALEPRPATPPTSRRNNR